MEIEKIHDILNKFSIIYLIIGDKYRSKAYDKAATTIKYIKKLPTTIDDLMELNGIGESIAKKIHEYLETGKIKEFDNFIKKYNYVNTLINIYGMGSKKLITLVNKYKIKEINDIKKLYINNEIEINKAQLLGLFFYDDINSRIQRDEVTYFIKKLRKNIKDNNYMFEIAGSYRRELDTVGDIDIVLSHKNIKSYKDVNEKHINDFINYISESFQIIDLFAQGTYIVHGLVKIHNVRKFDIVIAPLNNYFTTLLYLTGSKHFNINMRSLARKHNLLLNEKGLFRENGEQLKVTSEHDVFKYLGMNYIEPKNRK